MSRKESPKTKKLLTVEAAAQSTVRAGDISHVSGDVNIAGKIIQNIETFQQRALTPAEVVEKDLQIEINELARGVRGYLERLKQQVSAVPTYAAYKELEAYTLSETRVFFGRDRAIRDLCDAMKRGLLTVLQAESGAGKTSLLQAGVMPRLIAEEQLAVLIRPQFESPSHAIKETFIGNLELTPRLAKAPLVDFLRKVKAVIGHHTILYLILDQFEEFFSKKTLEQDRQEFITDLSACLNDTTLNVRWVISITTDVFGQLAKFEPYVQNPFSNVQSLYLFNRQDASEVIENTAREHGLSFEKELLDCILSDLGHQHDDPIAPTHIQLVCTALYNDIRDKGTCFTCELYAQKGGAEGILHDYIGSVLNRKLPPEERSIAYKIFEALVTSEKKRLIRLQSELELDLKSRGVPSEALETTLNHLVAGRLLRRYGEDPHRIQYEIVHDYLLKEIEIDDNVRKLKEAEELLDQGVKNWGKQKLLLAPDALRILEATATDVPVSSAAAELLFFSAIEYGRPARRWMDLIPAAEQKSLTTSLLAKQGSRKNREALWLLRPHLTAAQTTKVVAVKSSLGFWTFLKRGTLAFLIAVAVFIVGSLAVESTRHFVPWRQVTSFDRQCLGGDTPSGLLVGMDALEASHVVVYDARSHKLCETQNTGAKWRLVDQPQPGNLAINSIAVHSSIYLATDQGLYYQTGDAAWQGPRIPPGGNFNLRSIAVSSDNTSVYVSTEQDSLYHYDLATGNWQELLRNEITGKITDITVNYDYFAVSTRDGIWYRKLASQEPWNKFDSSPKEDAIITSLEMAFPVRSWEHYIEDPTYDDWFLLTTSGGEVYLGALTESRELETLGELPADATPGPIVSLAVNDPARFVAKSTALYCEQSWTILNREWWLRSRLSREQPCK